MSEATATQTQDTIQVMTWLQQHNPTVMEAWWHGDHADLKRAVMTLAAQLKGIHDEVSEMWVNEFRQRDYEEYLEGFNIGNQDHMLEVGEMLEAQSIMEFFGCKCQPPEEEEEEEESDEETS